MHGNRGNISDGFHIPDFAEQLILRKYMVRILREKSQQVKFLRGEIFFFPVHPDPSGRLVNLDPSYFDDIIFRHPASDQALIARQVRLDTCDKLTPD